MAFRKIIKDSEGGQKYVTEQEEELVFDQVPTESSFNPVTSDGVKKGIDESSEQTKTDIEKMFQEGTSEQNKLVNENGVQDTIDNAMSAISTGYIPKGTASVSAINALTEQQNGDMYVVSDSGTISDGNVTVNAGESVAWDASNSVWYKVNNYALRQFGTDNVKNLPTSIGQFRTGDVIPVDGPNGPAKMPTSDLQDAILGGPIDEAVQAWLNEHPEATTTVQDGSLTEAKFSEALKLQTIKDYVTPEMFGAIGDGVTDDTDAINSALAVGRVVIFKADTYIISDQLIVESDTRLIGFNSRIKVKDQERIDVAMLLVDHKSNIVIEGLIFDENMSEMPVYDDITLSTQYNIAVKFTYSSNLIVKNCVFENLYNMSLSLYASSGVIDILDNTFKSLVQPQGYLASHISLGNITQTAVIRIVNNQFLNDYYDNSAFGVCDIDASNITNSHLLIENNRLINCGRDILYTHRLHPIDFYTNVSNAVIRGNYIKSRYGLLRLDDCTNIVFENNVVDIELPATTDLAGDGALWIVSTHKSPTVPKNITVNNNVFNMSSNHSRFLTIYNTRPDGDSKAYLENIKIANNVFNSDDISNVFVVMDYCVKNVLIEGNVVRSAAANISIENFTLTDTSVETAENIVIRGNDLSTTARVIVMNAYTNKNVKNIVISDNKIKSSAAYGVSVYFAIRCFNNYFETAAYCNNTSDRSFCYDNLFYNQLGSQGEVDFNGTLVIKHDNYKLNGTKID